VRGGVKGRGESSTLGGDGRDGGGGEEDPFCLIQALGVRIEGKILKRKKKKGRKKAKNRTVPSCEKRKKIVEGGEGGEGGHLPNS